MTVSMYHTKTIPNKSDSPIRFTYQNKKIKNFTSHVIIRNHNPLFPETQGVPTQQVNKKIQNRRAHYSPIMGIDSGSIIHQHRPGTVRQRHPPQRIRHYRKRCHPVQDCRCSRRRVSECCHERDEKDQRPDTDKDGDPRKAAPPVEENFFQINLTVPCRQSR